MAVAVEDPILTPILSAFDELDRLPEQRMKWVRDPDQRADLPGAACS
ncbi:MAG: hypothetical protein ACRD2A_15505 [Vicinamibacterales bacterium]